ncbi:MAG: AraC family transcriptional regulator, partial [Clostridia bacterium]|nr:AraC family transcriptional regulator [Clostridia bacterium]
SVLHDLKLQAVYSGTFSTEKAVDQAFHQHNFCEIMLITEGFGKVLIKDKTYDVKKGDIVIYPPKGPHTEKAEKNKLSTNFFAIKYDRVSLSVLESDDFYPIINTGKKYNSFLCLFDLLIKESENQETAYYNEVLNSICKTIFFEILNLAHVPLTSGKVSESFDLLKKYIDVHFKEEFRIKDVCDQLAINKFYVSKLFKEYLGTTPVRYVIEKRIEYAKRLLKTTDLSVKEIAENVGYGDSYHFSKLFKKEVGVSPKSFRENLTVTI